MLGIPISTVHRGLRKLAGILSKVGRLLMFLQTTVMLGATFTNSARITVSDPTGDLSWKPEIRALTISCWFKLTVPSDRVLSEHMTILVNRQGGGEGDAHSYLVQFNHQTGNIEFSARGSSGVFTSTLIERPYLERWYHVAVVRSGDEFFSYVDGRPLSARLQNIGDSGSDRGLSIGGWGSSRYLLGEVVEVAVYQSALSQDFIVGNMFRDQPAALPALTGYFKLAYSTNGADSLRNFATASSVPAATRVGPVEFEETNKAGEQSAFDARKNGGRDALTPLSGAYSWQQVALSRPTPGIGFEFRFGYSSGNAFGGYKLGGNDPYAAGALGGGWRHSFETRVLPAQTFSPLSDVETVGLLQWSGAIDIWDRKDSESAEYQPRDRAYKGELLSLPNGNLQWTTPERLRYLFESPGSGFAVMRGRLLEIRDLNGNVVSLRYNETTGVLTNVVDTVRGTNVFLYNAQNLLTNFTFNSWHVNFGYDSSNRLSAKWITNTAPAAVGITTNVNTRWEFRYGTNGLLSQTVDPRGITNLTVFYDRYGRQTNQVDALLRSNRTEYGVPGKRQIRRTDAEGKQWLETYDRKGRIVAHQDPLTNVTRHTYDDRGNRTSITEPLGWQTFFGYDERANVIARTNALGQVTTWKFHPFFNKAVEQVTPQPTNVNGFTAWTNRYELDNQTGSLIRHHDDLGTLVSYRYETNGLVLASTNANGWVTRYGYNSNGFLISRTEPFTNAASTVTHLLGVNDVGWKVAETNALLQRTTYAFDLNGNVVETVDPLNRSFIRTHDPNGNLLTASDGKGRFTRHGYDATITPAV